jgi:hypothetical protein
MKDPRIYDFRADLLKTITATTAWMGIGFLVLNAISGRRVLECDRQSSIVQCHLTEKQWLEEKTVSAFEGAKLQKAIVTREAGIIRGSGGGTRHQATLVTTQGNIGIGQMDSYQFAEKHYTVDRINAYLENPQSPKLKVEATYSSLFWTGTGIFMAGFALLSFGVAISWRLSTSASGSQ